jgi:WD40 repeat protein
MVASTSGDRTILLWDVATEKRLRIFETFEGHRNIVTGLALSPDGKIVASALQGEILLWDAVTGGRLLRLEGHWDTATGVAFSLNSNMVASISEGAVNL